MLGTDDRSRERDREAEVQAHLELLTAQLVDRGVPPEEASRRARLLFGNPRAAREAMRDGTWTAVAEAVLRDLRLAVRMLRKSPAFTVTALVMLSLAIGSNTAVFSLADAILLRPLPYPHPERLATVVTTSSRNGINGIDDSQSGTSWETLRDDATTVDVALWAGEFSDGVNLVVDGHAAVARQARVSAGYFRVLGVPPLIGREFTRDEDRADGPAVAIISYRLWKDRLGGAPDIIGRSLMLRGATAVVVGVMPPTFQSMGEQVDLWTPARPTTTGEGSGDNYGVLARVKDGVRWAAAVAELNRLGVASFSARGQGTPGDFAWSLRPLKESATEDVVVPLELIAGAVGLVLLLACVNLSALVLARGRRRTKEIATRIALGSGRAAVVRQVMVESLLLSAVGAALGVFVGTGLLSVFRIFGSAMFSTWTPASLDGRALVVTGALSIGTSLLLGVVPALQASRLDINTALLEDGSRGIIGGSRHRLRRVLVATEVALGVVLLVVTGLLVRTFANLHDLDPGFDTRAVTTASVSLQDARYQTSARVNALFDQSLDDLTQMPGVEAAAVSLELPYRRLLNDVFAFTDEPGRKRLVADVMYVTPGFFKTLGIPMHKGRAFSATDRAGSPGVAVVNETFVKAWGHGRDVVGRSIRLEREERTIVGIVGDVQVRNSGFSFPGRTAGPLEVAPMLFIPAAQTSDGFLQLVNTWFQPVWSVRTRGPVDAAGLIARAIHDADPLLPVQNLSSLADVQASATGSQRLLMTLIGALALTALWLAALGLYGLIAQDVAERRREFGVRIALGATAVKTARDVTLSGVGVSAAGAAVGLGLAWYAARLLESSSLLFRVGAHDPLTFVGIAVLLVLVSIGASLLPALAILRLDPADTLRA